MDNQTNDNSPEAKIIRQAILVWNAQAKQVSGYLNKYNDDHFMQDIAPGRNRGIYVLGHLVAVNDRIVTFFGPHETLFPELEPLFITNPDRSFDAIPAMAELRQMWDAVNERLNTQFSNMTTTEWMERHTRVSPEDFILEPHRNKLSLLLNRTSHMAYHAGQLALLKPEEVVA